VRGGVRAGDRSQRARRDLGDVLELGTATTRSSADRVGVTPEPSERGAIVIIPPKDRTEIFGGARPRA
jgi:hypothetical protein